ncbi:MAG: 30S ribosomal protein S12 methylthiotransferase RimO [Nitrospinae bacterium]|nr:30S ribosomal protein S12 methylthiotransferase RimO [Nitrospinota bacterium]
MKETIGLISLGCAKNTVDSEMLLGELTQRGYTLTNRQDEAEIIIINSCGFIAPAKEESVNTIIEMAQYKESGRCRKLIVMGCLSQKYGGELENDIPEIDHIVGAGDFKRVVEIIEGEADKRNLVRGPRFDYGGKRLITTPSHYAYLKISEGCSNRCTFCAIPEIRGDFRSRPLESIITEAKTLAAQGVRELNIISQDNTKYGLDIGVAGGINRLIEELASIDDIAWIRLLYTHPQFIDDRLIETLNRDKVCRYLDLPLQHCHGDILKAMGRRGDEQTLGRQLKMLRDKIPGLSIRTTFMVGFPGETEKQFETLLKFIEEQSFEHLGVFAYSQEDGTPAAKMKGQIPEEVKEERRETIMSLQREISLKKNKSLVGSYQNVLVEGLSDEGDFLITGRTAGQAPEVDGVVYLEKSQVERGQIVRTRITEALEYDLIGEVEDSKSIMAPSI